jgi:uncharacterized protein (DUF486 family)
MFKAAVQFFVIAVIGVVLSEVLMNGTLDWYVAVKVLPFCVMLSLSALWGMCLQKNVLSKQQEEK